MAERRRAERRRKDRALLESEERFRLLVTSVRDYAIFMLDGDGRVATWNAGAETIKGYRAEEILGQPIEVFYPPADRASGLPRELLARARMAGRVEHEGWRVRKDGTQFWADVVITAVRDRQGELAGFAKVTRDRTERRKLEEERLRSAQAHEAIRLRDEFLSIASHELKTPLAALQLQLESLQAGVAAVDAKMGQRLERVLRSAERLADLVGALLDVSRITAGHLELHPERFDLGDAAAEVVERMRDPAERAGCRLILHRDGAAEGLWDRLRIEQVLTNLVSNSIKYAARTPITISIESGVDQVVLEVSDEGPGIDEADLPRLFQRFERAASTRHYGGLGLGLYVARRIIEAHGGTIAARKSERSGARFVIQLPRNSASAKLAEVTSVEELH